MSKPTPATASEVRAFANANGIQVGVIGRLNPAAVKAFQEATGRTYEVSATKKANLKTLTVKVPHRTPSGKSAPKKVTLTVAEARKAINDTRVKGPFGKAATKRLVEALSAKQ